MTVVLEFTAGNLLAGALAGALFGLAAFAVLIGTRRVREERDPFDDDGERLSGDPETRARRHAE